VRVLIERFGLAPLPVETVLFARTYESDATARPGVPAATAGIGLFCSEPPSRSLFHRLDHDEVWHFYAGDSFRLVLLHADGSDEEVVLGGDVAAGRSVQHVVRAGVWQAGELVPGGTWALFGCTMAPGFTPGCFEGGRVPDLLASHPGREVDIERLGVRV
jgi:predicted cupin superfamily sugar epimerase